MKRVLIVKLSSLGDLFHALPAARGLKQGLGAELDWITQPEFADCVRCFSDVDRVLEFHRRAFWANLPGLLQSLRTERYDAVVDLQGILKSALVCRLARGGRRIGPSFHREGAWLFYDVIAGRRDKSRHAVEENMDVLRFLGLPASKPEFHVRFPAAPEPDVPRPRVALVPFSRWPTKNWPADRFAHTAAGVRERTGASFFILGSPSDVTSAVALAQAIGSAARNLAGRTTLPELGGLLAHMDLVIGNDSGPIHMAAAIGVPILAVYGPTDPARTGPYGEGHRVVMAAPDACPFRPCFKTRCKFAGLPPCLNAVRAETVAKAAIEMLTRHH